MVFNKDELELLRDGLNDHLLKLLNGGYTNEIEQKSIAIDSLSKKISKYIDSWNNMNPLEQAVDDKFFKFINTANYYKTRDYHFVMDICHNVIEVTGGIIEEYARVMDSQDLLDTIDDEVAEWEDDNISNDIRFCSICGAPMQEGYTNEEMYIDTDIEFFNYMNSKYGAGNWKSVIVEELNECVTRYFYKESTSDNWLPTPWHYTDWYNKY